MTALPPPMYVYFIKPVGMPGPIKIGSSAWPEDRVRVFQPWSPFPLELMAKAVGGARLEANLHDCFADAHSHGEWFHPIPRRAEAIAKIAAGVPIADAVDLTKRVRNIRGRNPIAA